MMIFGLNCLCGVIIILLIIAGVAYLLGADSLGELALDIIRLIFIILLVILLVGLILIIIGYVSMPGISLDYIPSSILPL
ncbi:MAG: hypothetical protein R6U61_01565 [Thermoplasmata archaeon]